MLSTRTITPDQLTAEEILAWREMVRSNPALRSPFFQPEFTQAVAHVNASAKVIAANDNGRPVAFLPFQLADTGEPAALGESLNDFQGIISGPHENFCTDDILRSAGIQRFFCAKMFDWRQDFQRHVIRTKVSPYVDLSIGYAAWENGLQQTGTCQLKQLARKERKLIREYGPIRFEFHTACSEVLTQLIDWKRDQYLRTKEQDALAAGWPVELLQHLKGVPASNEFQPVLSAMYAGNNLVAAHYGLISGQVCHWWFPAYNPFFGVYSPGKLLLRRLLIEASHRGLTRFDFGVGDEDYKITFANSADEVCRVIMDTNVVRRWLRTNWYRTRVALRETLVGPGLKVLHRQLREITTTTVSPVSSRQNLPRTAVEPSNRPHADQSLQRADSSNHPCYRSLSNHDRCPHHCRERPDSGSCQPVESHCERRSLSAKPILSAGIHTDCRSGA